MAICTHKCRRSEFEEIIFFVLDINFRGENYTRKELNWIKFLINESLEMWKDLEEKFMSKALFDNFDRIVLSVFSVWLLI